MHFDTRHYQRVCERVRRASATRDVDAVHDAFLETYRSGLEYFEARACLRAKDQYRKRRRDLQRLISWNSTHSEVADSAHDPQQTVAQREQITLVRRGVRKLSPNYRRVVELRFFEDLSPAEIANLLGVPVKTVYTRLERAIQRLRRMLNTVQEGVVL